MKCRLSPNLHACRHVVGVHPLITAEYSCLNGCPNNGCCSTLLLLLSDVYLSVNEVAIIRAGFHANGVVFSFTRCCASGRYFTLHTR